MKSNVNSKSVFSATLDYNIASLNILGAYIFGILVSSTSQLSKKISITWFIMYFLTYIIFSIISSSL